MIKCWEIERIFFMRIQFDLVIWVGMTFQVIH